MDWSVAQYKIREKIKVSTNLNTPKSTYRYVFSIDALLHKYKNENGFIVWIGKKTKIGIPWSMLKDCFNQMDSPNGYDGKYFKKRYPLQAQHHSCHVRVVGQIFVVSEIAYLDGDTYRLKEN